MTVDTQKGSKALEGHHTVPASAMSAAILMLTSLTSLAAPPIAQNDLRSTTQGVSLTINVLANDSDPDGDTLDVIQLSEPAFGTARINNDGSIRYTPNTTFIGTETLTYTITDQASSTEGSQDGATASAQIIIQVSPNNLETEANTLNDSRVGKAIDRFCHKIQGTTQSSSGEALLAERCLALYTLLNSGDTDSVDEALAQIAGEEVAAQFDTANEFAKSHMKLISDRLLELRMSGSQSSPLALTLNRQTFDPLQIFDQPTTGGNAGDSSFFAHSKFSLFINGSVGSIEKESTANEHGFDSDTVNITLGGDYRFRANLIGGAAIGYTEENITFSNNGGGLDTEAVSYTLYGTWFKQRWTLEGVIGLGNIDYHSVRNTIYNDLTSAIRTSSIGDTEGDQWLASFTLSYDMHRTNRYGELYLNPFINLEYIDTDTEAFSENGDGAWIIHYDQQSYKTVLLSLGLFTSQAVNTRYGVFTPQARVMAYHGFEDDPNQVSAYFINDVGRNRLDFSNNSPDSYYMQAGIGGAMTLIGGLSFFMDYEKVVQLEHTDIDRLSYGLRWELDL